MERQKLLEIERAKTRELRHNLDMEKEKQAQVITLKTGVCSQLRYNSIDFRNIVNY